MDINEARLKFEEQKFEVDKQERLQRLGFEKERLTIDLSELKTKNKLIEAQQNIIEGLLQNKGSLTCHKCNDTSIHN